MDGRTDGQTAGWMDGWLSVCMDGWMDGWMDIRMDGQHHNIELKLSYASSSLEITKKSNGNSRRSRLSTSGNSKFQKIH